MYLLSLCSTISRVLYNGCLWHHATIQWHHMWSYIVGRLYQWNANLIKIGSFLNFYLAIHLTSYDILYVVMSEVIFSISQSMMSRLFFRYQHHTLYMQELFSNWSVCLTNLHMIGWLNIKQSLLHYMTPNRMWLDVCVSHKKIKKKKIQEACNFD